MKTYSPKPEHIERRWYVIDAGEQVLGRVATEAAVVLRGKHKPIFAPHMDVGDNLIIINAAKVVLTGGKETKKVAWRHSGHPGGITGTLYEDLLEKRPAFVVEKAVRGMLPKNRLGRAMIKKLHVVPGPEHNHQAQKPQEWTMGMRPVWEGLPTSPAPLAAEKKAAPKGEAAETPAVAKRSATAKEPARHDIVAEGRGHVGDQNHGEEDDGEEADGEEADHREVDRQDLGEEADRHEETDREEVHHGEEADRREDDGEEEGDVVATTPTTLTTGRRKAAIARVRLVPGTGEFRINDRSLDDYFPTRVHRMVAQSPLRSVGRDKDFDVVASITGGGVNGQAGALRLGIARALLELEPDLRAQLKAEGFLRRDAREKERRKYGLKKARKAPQYSKR